MRQCVINPESEASLSVAPRVLTQSTRIDGPHSNSSASNSSAQADIQTPEMHLLSHDVSQLDPAQSVESPAILEGKAKLSMSWKSRLIWWCNPQQWFQSILRLQDTPHSIALGTAIGVFVSLTPTFGIQMLLVLTLALLFRPFFQFNKFAALVAVYISNPLTMVPIYWMNYRIGAIFTGVQIERAEFVQLFRYSGYAEWWSTITNVFYTLGTPLVVGSLLVAISCALPTYPVMLRILKRVQALRELEQAIDAAKSSDPQRRTIADS